MTSVGLIFVGLLILFILQVLTIQKATSMRKSHTTQVNESFENMVEANRLANQFDISDVLIVSTNEKISAYLPKKKRVTLGKDIENAPSHLARIIVQHEMMHAVQHLKEKGLFRLLKFIKNVKIGVGAVLVMALIVSIFTMELTFLGWCSVTYAFLLTLEKMTVWVIEWDAWKKVKTLRKQIGYSSSGKLEEENKYMSHALTTYSLQILMCIQATYLLSILLKVI